MPKTNRKPETNAAFVKRIMSQDSLMQMFVISALDVYARQILAAEPIEHGLLDGKAWKICAQSMIDELKAR